MAKSKTRRESKKSLENNLDAQLAQLETAQLVRRTMDVDLAYIFKHALVQDTAYASLLKTRRAEMHRHVARAYEQLYGDRLDEFAAILAQHYDEAGVDDRAFEYSARAGNYAARLYANTEAIAQYDRAIEIAKRILATDAQKIPSAKISELYLKRGRAFELNGKPIHALKSYEDMEAAARERNDPALELAALMARATLFATPTPVSNSSQAQLLLDRALALANKLGDRAAESKILWSLLLQRKFSGRASEGVPFGERSLAIARELGLREQMAFTLNDLGLHGYAEIGHPQRGLEAMKEARDLWQSLNNHPMLADTLSNMAVMHCTLGNYAEACEFGNQARQISETIGNLWGQSYSRFVRGEIELEYGEISNALTTMKDCIQLAQQAGFTAPLVWVRTALGMAYADLGQVEQAIGVARQAVDAAETQFVSWKAWAQATLGRLELRRGNLQAATALLDQILADTGTDYIHRTWFHMTISMGMFQAEIALAQGNASHAIEILEMHLAHLQKTGARHFVAEMLTLKARLLLLDKQPNRAREVLVDARALAESLGSKWRLWRIFAVLADVEAQCDNLDQARTWREQSHAIIEFIVAQTPPELRESFLNLPTVRQVTENANPA